MFGLDREGFKRKKYSDVVESMQDRATDIFGEDINLNNNSFLGMLINVIAWAIAIVWEQAEYVYYGKYVDFAEGNNLDLATRNNGITRRGAERARGTATFNAEVPAGLLLASGDIVFITLDRGLTVAIEAVDGGVTGNLPANSVGEILTPVPGVTSFTSTETTGGRDIETDAELRLRFFSSLGSSGASTVNSIVAELLETKGVRSASVTEIEEGAYFNGIRIVVLGGEKDDVAQAILNKKALGVKTVGGTVGKAKAQNGQIFDIKFDYANEVKIDANITLTVDGDFPSNGHQLVELAIKEYLDGLTTGQDVIYTRFVSGVFRIEGVIDAEVEISKKDGVMAKNNIQIASDEVAKTNDVIIL